MLHEDRLDEAVKLFLNFIVLHQGILVYWWILNSLRGEGQLSHRS